MCKNIINNKCLYFDPLVTVLDAPVGISIVPTSLPRRLSVNTSVVVVHMLLLKKISPFYGHRIGYRSLSLSLLCLWLWAHSLPKAAHARVQLAQRNSYSPTILQAIDTCISYIKLYQLAIFKSNAYIL